MNLEIFYLQIFTSSYTSVMNKRPKIELKLARIDKVLEILGWVAVFAIWVLALTSYSNLPDTIPIHYNAMGQADNIFK